MTRRTRGRGRAVVAALGLAAAAAAVLVPRTVHATFHLSVIDEICASLDGDDTLQFVEIRQTADGQNQVRNSVLAVFDATGAYVRNLLVVPDNVPNSGPGVPWLMATDAFQTALEVSADFTFAPGLPTTGGMVCWGKPGTANRANPRAYVDCVAYGAFTGTNAPHGPPTRQVPVGHSLERLATSGDDSHDFACAEVLTPENNDEEVAELIGDEPCRCPDGTLDEDEQCDGTNLGGASCQSLGFSSGLLECRPDCGYDTGGCTNCGNGAVDPGEACDGANLGGATCPSLGFAQGDLACAADCTHDTSGCIDFPSQFIRGGGPRRRDCFAEWAVRNAPRGTKRKQVCVDGASCDVDPAAGSCRFRVRVCLNTEDGTVVPPCTPGGASAFRVRRPDPLTATGFDLDNATALLDGVRGLGGSVADGVVSFDPALAVTTLCTEWISIDVPVRTRANRVRPGTTVLKTATSVILGPKVDEDALKLVCRPVKP
jgi:hypothetical protein